MGVPRLTIALALLTASLLALAAGSSAQAACRMNVQLHTQGFETTPDTLSGTYQGTVEAQVTAVAGLPCPGTTTTTVPLEATGPEDIELHLDPAEHTISWPEWYQEAAPSFQLPNWTIEVTAEVPASYASAEAHRVHIGGTAKSDGPLTETQLLPTQMTLTFPDDPAGQAEEASPSSTRPTDQAQEDQALAPTALAGDPEANGVPALALPALLAGLAAVALIHRRG